MCASSLRILFVHITSLEYDEWVVVTRFTDLCLCVRKRAVTPVQVVGWLVKGIETPCTTTNNIIPTYTIQKTSSFSFTSFGINTTKKNYTKCTKQKIK